MNTTKKFTIKLQAFSPDELKLSSDVDISQYLNTKIPQEWLPVLGTKWKPFISVGDYGNNGPFGEINITSNHLISFRGNYFYIISSFNPLIMPVQ